LAVPGVVDGAGFAGFWGCTGWFGGVGLGVCGGMNGFAIVLSFRVFRRSLT
jgi:hypothetical protein